MKNLGLLYAFLGGAIVGAVPLCFLLLKKVRICVAALKMCSEKKESCVLKTRLMHWWSNLPLKLTINFVAEK